MDKSSRDLARQALRDVRRDLPIDPRDWDLLLRQARLAGLLARFAEELRQRGQFDAVPPQARQHLAAASLWAGRLGGEVRREVADIKATLGRIGVATTLLKGAAYVVAEVPAALGRVFGDIDVLVPIQRLQEVEKALAESGWRAARVDAHDARYYREWMHQIPPMTHLRRQTTIDVHHTIVARTTRLQLQPEKLFAASVAVAGDPMLRVLAPTDMVLHSATHLLNEGDFENGLRDLDDLNLLLRHFGADTAFWPALVERAAELDLERPLYYALRYTKHLLGTPVPDAVADSPALHPPGPVLRGIMDAFFERALRSTHPSCRDWLSPLALRSLYIRGHLLLMPAHILVPHLLHKAMKRTVPQKPPPAVPFDP